MALVCLHLEPLRCGPYHSVQDLAFLFELSIMTNDLTLDLEPGGQLTLKPLHILSTATGHVIVTVDECGDVPLCVHKDRWVCTAPPETNLLKVSGYSLLPPVCCVSCPIKA